LQFFLSVAYITLNKLFAVFLPRDASAERGDATVNRLSVRNDQVPYSKSALELKMLPAVNGA